MVGKIKVKPYDKLHHTIIIHVKDEVIDQPGHGRALLDPEESRNLINQIEAAIKVVK